MSIHCMTKDLRDVELMHLEFSGNNTRYHGCSATIFILSVWFKFLYHAHNHGNRPSQDWALCCYWASQLWTKHDTIHTAPLNSTISPWSSLKILQWVCYEHCASHWPVFSYCFLELSSIHLLSIILYVGCKHFRPLPSSKPGCDSTHTSLPCNNVTCGHCYRTLNVRQSALSYCF